MKRTLAFLCVLALVLSLVPATAFAATQDVQAEIDAGAETIVLEADASNITITRDSTIDLNGHDLDGVSVLAGILYIMDSATADYTVADGVYGHVTNATGAVKAAEGYLQVGNSFHAVNLDIYAMTLRAADVGVYYKSNFAADEIVAAEVESFGVALSVVTAPNASNLETYCGYSEFTSFEAGEGANSVGTSTLLKNIMKASNGDAKNGKNAAMPVYGSAYIKTSEGYYFGETVKRSLQEQVEAIDGVWSNLSDAQKSPVLAMLESYTTVMEGWNIPNIRGIQTPGADAEIEIPVNVTAENGVVTEAVTVEQSGVSVTVPAGVKLAEGVETLTLTVTPKETSDAGLTLEESQVLMPMDVHVEGLAADNAQPLTIYLGKVMAENLNMGNYAVYHVENGKANEMILIPVDAAFTAHNQYKYTLDGELTLYLASFSEVTVISEDAKWEGNRDYSWYNTTDKVLYIRNADQLAGFSAIVGDMAFKEVEVQVGSYTLIDIEQIVDEDSFEGKTVVLLADIDLGDRNNASEHIFYPIGYGNASMSYVKPSDGTATGTYMQAFKGTFDGNGHTISNIYQNTWQMWGNCDGNNYNSAMGLFAYVIGGTIKNLTVDNFSSDGEYAPTGVIAAYAVNSTFENIAITNCNPRVYNTGNGGIIGIAGSSTDKDTLIQLSNITVDNTNKISALWGSYDVACGGLVGMFHGNANGGTGKIHFENCHVSAQMDVYNDVCANYQYYAYRYTGMLIGSVRHNETIDGHVYPNMTGITANDCTVHFGTWNDYYYCELVANSLASYTHDHQFSRLTQVAAVDADNMQYVPLGETKAVAIPTSGRVNYVVVNGEHATENAICYHFVDGKVHNHDDYNGDGVEDFETVNGESLRVENNRHIYLEFNNLITGYGWGVTTKYVGQMEGVTILDRETGIKFAGAADAKMIYSTGESVEIGKLFAAVTGAEIDLDNVQVFVASADPADETITVSGVYTANKEDWTKGTLTFSGRGEAIISITDYQYCEPTTLKVRVQSYTEDLQFIDDAKTQAYCPACKKIVNNWVAVKVDEEGAVNKPGNFGQTTGAHYYLGVDITYSDENANFMLSPGGTKTACFHLNGKNVEITVDLPFAWSNGGYLNILGDGKVTKTTGSGNGLFHSNTSANSTDVRVYGGDYVAEKGYTVWIKGNGGRFSFYEGVTLTAGSTAVRTYEDGANYRAVELYFEGVEINGGIAIRRLDAVPGKTEENVKDSWGNSYVTLINTTVTGTVEVDNEAENLAEGKVFAFTVGGSTVIPKLVLKNDAQLILQELTEGANIKVDVSAMADPTGPISVNNVENALAHIFAHNDKNLIYAKNGQLYCRQKTHTDDLVFPDGDNKAYCTACEKTVTWTPIASGELNTAIGQLNRGDHYYLTGDTTYTGAEGSFITAPSAANNKKEDEIGDPACVHLNGFDLTAKEKVYLFYGSSGELNILGDGVVTGEKTNLVRSNTIGFGCIRLYSGTYTQVPGIDVNVIYVGDTGGKIEIHKDVKIDAIGNNEAISMGSASYRASELYIYGVTINGSITTSDPVRKTDQYTTRDYYKKGAGKTIIQIEDAKITGKVSINDADSYGFEEGDSIKDLDVTISGKTKITELVLKYYAKVNLTDLAEGAKLTLGAIAKNAGYYTVAEDGTETAVSLGSHDGKVITVVDGEITITASEA